MGETRTERKVTGKSVGVLGAEAPEAGASTAEGRARNLRVWHRVTLGGSRLRAEGALEALILVRETKHRRKHQWEAEGLQVLFVGW